jgi:hypothetical protein
MKKFLSLVLAASIIGSLQARDIYMELSMPECPKEPVYACWRCEREGLSICVTAIPCEDCEGQVCMNVRVCEMCPEGRERTVCNPEMITRWGVPATMCMTCRSEGQDCCEEMRVTVRPVPCPEGVSLCVTCCDSRDCGPKPCNSKCSDPR